LIPGILKVLAGLLFCPTFFSLHFWKWFSFLLFIFQLAFSFLAFLSLSLSLSCGHYGALHLLGKPSTTWAMLLAL
jgi:hypothetical protein